MHNKYTYKNEKFFNIHDYNCKKRNKVKINADPIKLLTYRDRWAGKELGCQAGVIMTLIVVLVV